MKLILLSLFVILSFGCSIEEKADLNMHEELFRLNLDKSLIFDCGKYGDRSIWYDSSNSQYLTTDLKQNWAKYWPELEQKFENMMKENDEPEWGSLEMLNGEWEIHVYDSFTDENPMPDGRIILSLMFIVDGDFISPSWDVFLDYGKVTHSQPSF